MPPKEWSVLSPHAQIDENACQTWHANGAVPPHVRKLGRFPDTSNWWPGDLVLTKDLNPDWFSRKITGFQIAGGYSQEDSAWTHAAVYMGDGLTVCEATIPDWRWWNGRVMLSDLYNYCGGHELRIRRSVHLNDEKDMGWRIAIEAVTQLGKPYDMDHIAALARSILKGNGFWKRFNRRTRNKAVVCSTLYADVHNKVTDVTIQDGPGGVCVPAYLSLCSEFVDIPVKWAVLRA